jgi:alcohol dehydrogenase
MTRKFEIPRVIITGRGSHSELKNLPLLEGKRKALLICDSARVDSDVENNIKQDLKSRGIDIVEFREASKQVESEQLEKGLKLLSDNEIDLIVAIGGRGAIHLGKLLAFMATNEGPIENYVGVDSVKNPSLPLVAVAMTAGSGAAISHCACFIDSRNLYRSSVCDHHLMPEVAILDPGLKSWQQPREIAADGLTSISYAIEAVMSTESTPVTDACALSALTLLGRWLPVAYAHGNDINAREILMYAQQLVAMAIYNSTPSTVCKLAGQIEAYVHINFGHAIAALLPPLLEFFSETQPEKVELIGEALWKAESDSGSAGQRPPASELMRHFIQRLDLPLQLSFEGLEERHVENLMKMLDGDHYGRPVTHPSKMDKLIDVLRRAL